MACLDNDKDIEYLTALNGRIKYFLLQRDKIKSLKEKYDVQNYVQGNNLANNFHIWMNL